MYFYNDFNLQDLAGGNCYLVGVKKLNSCRTRKLNKITIAFTLINRGKKLYILLIIFGCAIFHGILIVEFS